jgi:hypothetical protein
MFVRLAESRFYLGTAALDVVPDTLYRDAVNGHRIGWTYVILPKQPKTKGFTSSAPNGDMSCFTRLTSDFRR